MSSGTNNWDAAYVKSLLIYKVRILIGDRYKIFGLNTYIDFQAHQLFFCPFLFQVITSLEEKYVHQLVKRFTSDLKNILVYDRVRESVEKFCANNTIDEVF